MIVYSLKVCICGRASWDLLSWITWEQDLEEQPTLTHLTFHGATLFHPELCMSPQRDDIIAPRGWATWIKGGAESPSLPLFGGGRNDHPGTRTIKRFPDFGAEAEYTSPPPTLCSTHLSLLGIHTCRLRRGRDTDLRCFHPDSPGQSQAGVSFICRLVISVNLHMTGLGDTTMIRAPTAGAS